MQQYQLLPDLTPEEYDTLKADIAARGVQVPVEYDEAGAVLDGHHRVRACEELGVKDWPRIVRVGMTEQGKRNHVRALNLLRRHLGRDARNEQMRAMRTDGATYEAIAKATGVSVGTAYAETYEAELFNSEKLMGADGKARPAAYTPREKQIIGLFNPTATDVERAQAWRELTRDTEPVPSVMDSSQVRSAYQKTISRPVETPALPDDRYTVLYADPPWQYGDKRTGLNSYGPAESEYPTMSIAELCALAVPTICAEDAALFMWVTSPLLAECFAVIDAWGFTYKASFVWDKVRHNFGHYNSVRHEFLLVCTRGSCLPESKELHDSVVSLERSTTHSQKPEYFRRLIEELYPSGKRIELFARQEHDGWDTWGAEV